MNNQGYIRYHRKILDNPIVMKDADYFAIWSYLLLKATHKKMSVIFKGKKIELQPGQLITGRKIIANDLKGISESKIYRILNCYESERQIEQQKDTKNTLITIVNWQAYQKSEQQLEQNVNKTCTESEQQIEQQNNSKKALISLAKLNNIKKSEQQIEQQLNNKWTATEQQLNTNNNVNNEINNISTTTISERNGNKRNGDENLYDYVQKVFGRLLGSAEIEVVSKWKDNELTRYAIRQAELSRAFNVKYVDRILFSYEKDGIKTVTDAEIRDKNFQLKKENLKLIKNENRLPSWFNQEIKEERIELTNEQKREREAIENGTYRPEDF